MNDIQIVALVALIGIVLGLYVGFILGKDYQKDKEDKA